MSLPLTGFNPYMPPELSIKVSPDAIYFAEHRTAHYYVSFKIIPDNKICEFFYCDATTRVDTRFPQDIYSNIYSRLPRNQAAFASIDWAPVIANPEEIVKHLVLQYLKAGVDPFGDDDFNDSIFQQFQDKQIGADYFIQVWDAIHMDFKTESVKSRLEIFFLGSNPIDPEILNYINFSDDPEKEEYCRGFNQGRWEHTVHLIKTDPEMFQGKIQVELNSVSGRIRKLASQKTLTSRQIAFLHVYLNMYCYVLAHLGRCYADLKLLNELLLNQWNQEHPEEPFPYVQEGVHFELDYRNDLMLAKPTPRTPELKSVKLHKVLLKTVLNYLKDCGITSQNSEYYKFVRFIPPHIANGLITRNGELRFFTEAYTAPFLHGPLTHYVQLFLLVQALTNDRILLQYSNESFTPKESIEMLFDPTFTLSESEFGFSLWGEIIDSFRTTNRVNGLLTDKFNSLSFCNPADVVSMIRELNGKVKFKALSSCLIISELKKLIKFSELHQIDLHDAYILLIDMGTSFNPTLNYQKEIDLRRRPGRKSVLENIVPKSDSQNPYLIQLKKV